MNAGFKSRWDSKHRWCFSSAGQKTSWCLVVFTADSWISALHIVSLPLCKPLSALTSCLTPPHPVDNVFSLSLSLLLSPPLLPTPRHGGSRCVTAGEEWHGSSQVPPFPQLSIYLLIGKKKNKTDEPRVSAPCLFQIIVWDNRLTVGLKKKKKSLCQTLWSFTTSGLLCFRGRISHRARR